MPELTETEAATAVVEWARATVDELEAGYPHAVTTKGALPDAVAVVQRSRIVARDDQFFPELSAIEQIWLFVIEIELSLMVAVPEPEDGSPAAAQAAGAAAQAQLEGFLPLLRDSLIADATLGDRVPMASKRFEADLTEPFIEYDDETRGRACGTLKGA
jgi:hypothetical protein